MGDFDPNKTNWGDNTKELLGGKTPAEIMAEETAKQKFQQTVSNANIGNSNITTQVLEALKALGIKQKKN